MLLTCPVTEVSQRERERERKVESMAGWLERTVSALPSRTSPVIAGDLNETFGLNNCGFGVGGRDIHFQSGTEREGARPWRKLAGLHGMELTTMKWNTGHTHFGDRSASKIDHFLLPKTLGGQVQQNCTLMKVMRALQIIPDSKPRDHALLL